MNAKTSPTLSASPSSVPPPGEVQRGHDGDAVSRSSNTPPIESGEVNADPVAGSGFFTKVAHSDIALIERHFSAHASVLIHLWIHLLTESFRQRSLVFTLADATIARRMSVSRATILRAKRALVEAKLCRCRNVKQRGAAWKNEPTQWNLQPGVIPGVFTDEHGGVHENTGGCSKRRASLSNTRKESLGPYGPKTTLSEEGSENGSSLDAGISEDPASGLPSRNYKQELFP